MAAEQFGPYRLDGLIGRGGMGEVYRAFDTVRGRRVALKRLPLALVADSGFQARFRRESALAARLGEPHIIPIHDYGEIDGQLFIDMRLVTGQDLATILHKTGPLAVSRALDLTGQIAQALDAAHRDGLAHRDVKPSNVLVSGEAGDEFAYLIDFGISRALNAVDATSLTATGAALGTLAYMAPERFLEGDFGCEVDVYSLGVMLFEILTGTKPFRGEGPAMIHAHLNVEPPKPSVRLPGVPTGLDDVVARGMAKNPRERYATAGELAAAARAAVIRGGIPAGRSERAADDVTVPGRAARTVLVPQPSHTGLGRVVAPDQPSSRRLRAWLIPAVALAAGLVLAGALFVSTRSGDSTASEMSGSAAGASLVTATIPVRAPRGVVASPDGSRLYVTNLSSGTVSVVDPARQSVTTTIPVGDQPFDIALDGAGTSAFVANANSDTVSVIDTASARTAATVPVGTRPVAVTVSPDGRTAYAASIVAGTVSVIDAGTQAVTATIPVGSSPTDLAVSPAGALLYVAVGSGRELAIVDPARGSVVSRIGLSGPPGDIALTPDGRRAYVTLPDSDTVSVVDLGSGTTPAAVRVGDNPSGLAIDPAGRRVYVTNNLSSTVSVIDTATDAVTSTITVGSEPLGVAVSPDGRRALVANYDSGTLSVVEVPG